MKIGLSVLENVNNISDLIMKDLSDRINKALTKAIQRIENNLRFVLDEAIRSQPEYSSLMAGTLKAELGLPDSAIVEQAVDYFTKSIRVVKNSIKYTTNKGVQADIRIELISDGSISSAINNDFANIQDVKGYIIPWLEWLLLEGTAILVKNYEVKYGSSPYSRSGMAIMVESNDSWSVPNTFAGKLSNNWITRAINNSEQNIVSIITSTIESSI